MLKVALGVMSAAMALAASGSAMAHGQEIANDLDRCGPRAEGPAVLVDVREATEEETEAGSVGEAGFTVLNTAPPAPGLH